MANEEHLAILKQGVKVWNQWRREHPEIRPDLNEADLNEADLYGADLGGADLAVASLREANLTSADLSSADLSSTDLSGAVLSQAKLRKATLIETYLTSANLTKADLSGATITCAVMQETVLNDLDLRQVKGLETVEHWGPSDIGIQTIYRSQGQIPEVFLRGAGVPENFIEYMRSLSGKAFVYYSCFISYSSKDQAFAERLHADLQSKGVRCWFAPEDLKIGDEIRSRLDESIRLHDKLLLVLSAHSIASAWVKKEVETAFERETREGKLILFPVRLDDTVMQTEVAWAADLRRMRHIGDFSRWKEHDAYQQAFARLLRDLQAEASAAGG